jgi:hypothetical protein
MATLLSPCHPACPGKPWERSRGTCSAPFIATKPRTLRPNNERQGSKPHLNFVIPSEAEGPAVRVSLFRGTGQVDEGGFSQGKAHELTNIINLNRKLGNFGARKLNPTSVTW